jgi:tetratricopeptide (TPR) repeat protein
MKTQHDNKYPFSSLKTIVASFSILLCLVLVVFIPLQTLNAQAAQAAFDRANEQLLAGNYRKAIRDYDTIISGGYESGALFLNMGLAYTEIDSLGMAKAWFLKAKTFDQTKEEALEALQFIETKFSRRSAVLPELPWESFVKGQLQDYGLKGLIYFLLISFNLLVFSILGYWYVPKNGKKILKYAVWILAFNTILLGANTLYARHLAVNYADAITIVKEHSVWTSPSLEEATEVSKAYEGYAFRIDNRKSDITNGWLFVRMSNGTEGWVQKNAVKIF